ncbi:hypothetical protein L0244_29890 [bacterium]|nr:hypothetical protein [bacterium]
MRLKQKTIQKQDQLELLRQSIQSIREQKEFQYSNAYQAISRASNPAELERATERLNEAYETLVLIFNYLPQDFARLRGEGNAA